MLTAKGTMERIDYISRRIKDKNIPEIAKGARRINEQSQHIVRTNKYLNKYGESLGKVASAAMRTIEEEFSEESLSEFFWAHAGVKKTWEMALDYESAIWRTLTNDEFRDSVMNSAGDTLCSAFYSVLKKELCR